MLPESSSDWRKRSINSSLADSRSETFAIHFSINALTPGSFTFDNDAGLIPFKGSRYKILSLKTETTDPRNQVSTELTLSKNIPFEQSIHIKITVIQELILLTNTQNVIINVGPLPLASQKVK